MRFLGRIVSTVFLVLVMAVSLLGLCVSACSSCTAWGDEASSITAEANQEASSAASETMPDAAPEEMSDTTSEEASSAVPEAVSDADIEGDNTVDVRQTADSSFLYDTSIYELTQADATHQGSTVQIVGEVVGDAIRAEEDPGKRWITLEAIEDEYESVISVLVDEETLGFIDTYGAYNRKGTTLQVQGTFYLACPSHEGIMDVHAENVTLVARGSVTHDEFNLQQFFPGLALVGVGVLLSLLYYYLRERER